MRRCTWSSTAGIASTAYSGGRTGISSRGDRTRPSPLPRSADAARAADAALLERRLAEAGLEGVARIVVHENRAVLVTVSRGVLRIQRGFAYAPDRVLRAVVTFVRGRGRPRREVERELLAFPVHQYVAARPPRRRHAAARPGDGQVVAALETLHRELNRRHFDGRLAPARFRLSERMRVRLADVTLREPRSGPVEIGFSRRHLRRDGWDEVGKTLLHEMVHQWQVESGLPLDHGAEFRRKAREVGVEPSARRRVACAPARRAAPQWED